MGQLGNQNVGIQKQRKSCLGGDEDQDGKSGGCFGCIGSSKKQSKEKGPEA